MLPQAIVAGELQEQSWVPPAEPLLPVARPLIQQLTARARELAQQALAAEAEAAARATLRIKDLQEQVLQATRDTDKLALELDEKEEIRERHLSQAEVRLA